jgi:hypothetical protein
MMSHTLQSLAGRDSFLADHSSTAEQKMFNALGLLVFVITLVTLSSTAYALYLINQTRHEGPLSSKLVIYIAVPLVTIVWSLIVFNFYRFSLSSSSSLRNSFGLKNITRLLIEIFFGLMIGITVSVPISVSISHEELKDGLLDKDLTAINVIESGIDKKYESELEKIYIDIASSARNANIANERLSRIEKLKATSEKTLNEAKANSEDLDNKLSDAKNKAVEIRKKITQEKIDIENFIKANDGLITNLQKALSQHKYLIMLITVFICLILIFPSIYQSYYIPGIYDHLVEYKNHIVLAKHGVLPHAHSIFIKENEVKVPYNTLPEEILREKIKDLNDHFNQVNDKLK